MTAERWRLLTNWDASPELQMGLDEALLERERTPPTLRLYTWSRDPLSLGYFQRFDDVPAALRAGSVVRRITGGGAIHHRGELTFSIVVPLAHRLYRGPVGESYERVHGALVDALAHVGIDAELRGERALESDREGTGMCFHHSTSLDVVWAHRKGVGSAQRRRGGRVLHHGSIKLTTTELEGEIATVAAHGGPERAEDFAPVLLDALAERFEIEWERAEPLDDELAEARRRGERYSSREFVHRR